MSNIAISVIIPIYNVEQYLRQCLDSILSQTLTNIEIICINDGSPDNCLEILREYEKNDSRIIVISRENRGVGFSRNEGINVATGEYVIFMDPDDWYPSENILLELYNKAKLNNALVCGGALCVYNNKELQYLEYPYAFDNEGFIEFCDYQYPFYFTRFLFNRSMLIENNIYFTLSKRFEDVPFMIKAMIAAGKFYTIKPVVYTYRINKKIINFTEDIIIDILKDYIECLIVSREHNLKKLHNFIANLLIDNHYPIQKYLNTKNPKVHIAFIQTLLATDPMMVGMDFVPYCLFCFFQTDVTNEINSNNIHYDVFNDALTIWVREINRKRLGGDSNKAATGMADVSDAMELSDTSAHHTSQPIPRFRAYKSIFTTYKNILLYNDVYHHTKDIFIELTKKHHIHSITDANKIIHNTNQM